MAITLPVVGGVTLPQVGHRDSYNEVLELRGSDVIMASGAMATDLVQSEPKRKFELKWKALTEDDLADIETAWESLATASGSFTSPRGGSYTVTRDQGATGLEITLYGSAVGIRADVSLRLREV